ncbi:MAG: hypothetical protein GXP44_02985 [bacterium]|nr:hypothetical protein [bacterium]
MNNQSNCKIIIRAQAVDEEFGYLMWLLGRMAFYNEHGYKIALPEHPFFINISNHPDALKTLDMDEAKQIFQTEIYDLNYFKNGLHTINENINLAKNAIEKMAGWVDWGFILFPAYEVKLTAYGPGGSYNYTNGNIIMKTTSSGKFKRAPSRTIVHETVHIGVEESIVNKFKLTHTEKEGLVDAICVNYFGDILTDYRIQERGDKNIFNIVSKNNIAELPQAIAEYKKSG